MYLISVSFHTAILKGQATKDQMAYTIAGRRLDKTPIPDLWIMHDRFKSEYQAELKAEKINNGLATDRVIGFVDAIARSHADDWVG